MRQLNFKLSSLNQITYGWKFVACYQPHVPLINDEDKKETNEQTNERIEKTRKRKISPTKFLVGWQNNAQTHAGKQNAQSNSTTFDDIQ